MPRETIHGEDSYVAAEVVWSNDQYVQLATLSTDAKTFIAWCRDLVERFDKAAKPRIEFGLANGDAYIPSPEPSPEPSPVEAESAHLGSLGMFWSPNRHQINQLIRILRRARNAAFGADE
jgi:hypothetical protein